MNGKRKALTVTHVKRVLAERLKQLRADEVQLSDHKGHPQVLELLHKKQGEISVAEDIMSMLIFKHEKPLCW